MSRIMQCVMKRTTRSRKLYKTSALWGFWDALLHAGYKRVPTKITCEECNKASQNSSKENKESQDPTCIVPGPTKINNDQCESVLQNLTIVPAKITNDESKSALQSPRNQAIVPTKIINDESKSALQSPQNRTVPTKVTNDESKSALQSPQNRTIVPTKITNDESKSALQSSQSRRNLDIIKFANNKCLQNRGLQNLQGRKRLCLVLDLDHTLVHSKLVYKLAPEKAKICLDNVAHKDDLFRWKSPGSDRLVKVRPFVRKFLEEADSLFEMYIYTMAERNYALHVANLLDPNSVYFSSRIISRENCTMNGQKGLDVVPVDESGILILDDTEKVWSRNLSNLILVEKYDYFKSISEEGMDESESAGPLSCVLKLLQEVHKLYFGQHHMLDVRVLLGMLRQRLRTENCV